MNEMIINEKNERDVILKGLLDNNYEVSCKKNGHDSWVIRFKKEIVNTFLNSDAITTCENMNIVTNALSKSAQEELTDEILKATTRIATC